MLTTSCNRKCVYCFAPDELSHSKSLSDMDNNSLDTVIDFLKNSSVREFRIIGGEPTLHSRFEEFYDIISDHGFYISIFTNGIFSEQKRKFLSKKNNLTLLLNINHPENYTDIEWQAVNATMQDLSKNIYLGFNIYKIGTSFSFLLDLIKKYNLQRKIRLGVANPTLGNNNIYLGIEAQRKISDKIVGFSRKCNMCNVGLSFDCGFILCAFTRRQLGELCYNTGYVPKTNCYPPIDISPDLKVFYCFALSTKSDVKLMDFKSVSEITDYFNNKFAAFKRIGGMDRCFKCKYLNRQQCGGGCLTHVLKTFL